MEHGTIALAPSTKRSKRLAAKKINNKRIFSCIAEPHKSNPVIQASRVTILILELQVKEGNCRKEISTLSSK